MKAVNFYIKIYCTGFVMERKKKRQNIYLYLDLEPKIVKFKELLFDNSVEKNLRAIKIS